MPGTQFTPELVDKLLDKLGSDDKFRADFQKDPDAAMSQLGAPVGFNCGGCMKAAPLASKKQIRQTQAIIKQGLLGLQGMDDPWLAKKLT